MVNGNVNAAVEGGSNANVVQSVAVELMASTRCVAVEARLALVQVNWKPACRAMSLTDCGSGITVGAGIG